MGEDPITTVTPPAEAPKPSGLKVAFGVLLGIAVVVGGIYLFIQFSASNRARIDNAKVGDCVKEVADDEDSPYRIVSCDDPSARYRVLQRITDPAQKCKEVAGAKRSVSAEGGEVCMGDKNVDPAKAVNVAKEGDCVRVSGQEAERIDCALPEAGHKVVKRLTDVSQFDMNGPCKGVPGAVSSYAWKWESQSGRFKVPSLTYDVVLCLGVNKKS